MLFAADPSATQISPQDAATATQLEDVIAMRESVADRVERFVDNIVAPPVNRGPARWTSPICVGVANLEITTAQLIADQVSAVADRAGLEIGEPGCSPNVLVVAADDGAAMARALVERRPRSFNPVYSGGAGTRRQLETFQNTDAPVRWWHISLPVTRETGDIAVRLPGYNPPMIEGANSRIRTATRNDLRRAFIIVDMNRVDGMNVQQLGDYIGMVALAQIDPTAETASYDTVLNLFEPGRVVEGVTDWDMSYLSALYGAELNRQHANQQAGEIAGIMTRDQTEQTPPAED
jgi:hypothetical protein